MSNETKAQIKYPNLFDDALTRSFQYSSIIGTAMGTLKAIAIISSEPEVMALANSKYAEIEKQLKEIYK